MENEMTPAEKMFLVKLELADDRRLYGNSFHRVLPDGSWRRIPPWEVRIAPGGRLVWDSGPEVEVLTGGASSSMTPVIGIPSS